MAKINIKWTTPDPEWVPEADNAQELSGLIANEVRYFFNKYKYNEFVAVPAKEDKTIFKYINEVLAEREMVFEAEPLLVSSVLINDELSWCNVWYKNGLGVNVMYNINNPKNRAVGFKLTEGMEVPKEFEGKFKFAHTKSKLAGIIRGSYFVVKGEYKVPKKHDNIINVE